MGKKFFGIKRKTKEKKIMSKNERAARKLLETAMGNMELQYLLPDFIDIPLTDIECKRIALNFPYSLQEIRAVFPTRKI